MINKKENKHLFLYIVRNCVIISLDTETLPTSKFNNVNALCIDTTRQHMNSLSLHSLNKQNKELVACNKSINSLHNWLDTRPIIITLHDIYIGT